MGYYKLRAPTKLPPCILWCLYGEYFNDLHFSILEYEVSLQSNSDDLFKGESFGDWSL